MILQFVAIVTGILLVAHIIAGVVNRKVDKEVKNEQKAWAEQRR